MPRRRLGGLRALSFLENGNSAQVVGQVVNLWRVGNPPRAPVNNRRAGCHPALQVGTRFRFGKTKWDWAESPPQAESLPHKILLMTVDVGFQPRLPLS